MPPLTSRDFVKVAAQRLNTAEFLLNNGTLRFTLDAMYIAGYTVECSLKALILEKTPVAEKAARLIDLTSGAKMHRPEVLAGLLADAGAQLPVEFAKRIRRADWSTDLRYETGRKDAGETRAFLRTAAMILRWTEQQMP